MREILFRGKRVDNGEWIEGFYAHSGEKKYILIDNDIAVGYLAMKEVKPDTIGQYTGLTDKNGTKIFEGDIVNYTQNYELSGNVVMVGTVKWSECYAGLCVTNFTNGLADRFLTNAQYRIEVIGNIYDNPELLRSDTE